ncbi:bifunctional nuclease 1-like [Hordeum vulgare]|nr:bifunctional nuclease 1-like [Hordeum vulgare]
MPTIYNVVKEMTEMMGYTVRLVRITEMVPDAFYSRLYLAKIGNQEEVVSFDLKPSDAINIAFRCKNPKDEFLSSMLAVQSNAYGCELCSPKTLKVLQYELII